MRLIKDFVDIYVKSYYEEEEHKGEDLFRLGKFATPDYIKKGA